MSYESNTHRDAIDILLAAAKVMRRVQRQSGELEDVEMPDSEILYYQTRNVSSPEFSGMVFQIKALENLAKLAPYAMSPPRANVIIEQIEGYCSGFKRAIDAKSSESRDVKNEKQATLIDKMVHHKEEKTLRLIDKSKSKSIGQYFGGGDRQDDEMR